MKRKTKRINKKKVIIIAITIISMFFMMGFAWGETPAGYTSITSADVGKVAGVNFSTTLRVYIPNPDVDPYNIGAVEWSDGGYFGPGTTIDPDYTMLYYRQATGYDNVPIYIYNTITGTGNGIETDYVYMPQGAVITSVGGFNLYKYNISAYNVDFDLNGAPGTPPPTQSVGSGYNPTAVTPPIWTNYNFLGWSPSQYAAAGNPAEYYTITQNTTLYAIWEYTLYNVNYNTNGGNTISATLDVNALPNPLPTPTKTGYNFLGWYYDSEYTTLAVAGTAIDNDVTLYAKWQLQQEPTYTITYDTTGGEPIAQQYNMRALPSQLPIPIYEGYAFQGWYYDSEYTTLAVAGTAITANVTLYAKWRYIDPLNEDYIDGYNDGYATGYGVGYWEGYEDGHIQGGIDGIDVGWFKTVMSGIAVIFSIKVFGDITLATFIGIPLLFAIILWIKKLLG
jgi:uncharacterized repeat protein (TIGR02543 family)